MWTDIEVVNGYSALVPSGLGENLSLSGQGSLHPETAAYLLGREAMAGGLLSQMGVDGLLVPPELWSAVSPRLLTEWRLRAFSPTGRVYQRLTPTPRAFSVAWAVLATGASEFYARIYDREGLTPAPMLLGPVGDEPAGAVRRYGPVQLERLEERRLSASLQVRASPGHPGLVVFARPWYPGYAARLADRPLPVRRAQGMLLAVELPAGASGTLRLDFQPRAVTVGLPIVGATLFLLGLWCLRTKVASRAAKRSAQLPDG
jgi:hypothetical protein